MAEQVETTTADSTGRIAQEKASLIWGIADTLRGLYKPAEYGRVILPMTVIKRFHDCLLPTHDAVMAKYEQVKGYQVKDGFLKQATGGYAFYNTSGFTWKTLLADPDNIESNFRTYLDGFSDNVHEILFKEGMNFEPELEKMANNGVLYEVVSGFGGAKGNFAPDKVSEVDMGYVFENLVRRFSEGDEAGEHFTSRDIVYLMTDLVIAADPRVFDADHVQKSVYDGSMGTSQMLSCMRERLLQLDSDATVTTFGQELNPFTFAIAKASAMIRGEDADNMRRGNTYDQDRFKGYTFDYVIQNPPFGIEFKAQLEAIKSEHAKGEDGRFPCELPSVSDGQTLFALNGLAKLKDDGIMAIVQDASPLYKGAPGKGEDDYRRYVLEHDWLEAIVQLPNDAFYNTGIATYVWLFNKEKPAEHADQVLLVDASQTYVKRRKAIGEKRVDLTPECRELVVKAYGAWCDGTWTDETEDGAELVVEAKLFDSVEFGFNRITVCTPERDADGNVVRNKKGVPEIAVDENGKKMTDTEDVPLDQDIDDYVAREVEPYNPGAFVDRKKTVVGYIIPFTRAFYKYKELEPADVIAGRILEHEKNLEASLEALFGSMRAEA